MSEEITVEITGDAKEEASDKLVNLTHLIGKMLRKEGYGSKTDYAVIHTGKGRTPGFRIKVE